MTMSDEIEKAETQQREMPFALVQGAPLTDLPKDLYIPPDALEVFLEAFEGPLDLLLYLIKKQNIDILDIPIAKITEQYMSYIELMEILELELAGEYLLMAAMLAEIKSRMLLPRQTEDEEEGDPRAELIRRLQEYERYKDVAEKLDDLPRYERDIFSTAAEFTGRKINHKPPEVAMETILQVFSEVIARAEMFSHHMIQREALSVRERMGIILEKINTESFVDFIDLFTVEEGRAGAIVSLLAILQLMKDSLIQLVQNEPNGKIYVKAAS